MIKRSAKWQTVHVPADAFARISRPFSVKPGSPPPSTRRSRGDG
jgi:hypothetical protein